MAENPDKHNLLLISAQRYREGNRDTDRQTETERDRQTDEMGRQTDRSYIFCGKIIVFSVVG